MPPSFGGSLGPPLLCIFIQFVVTTNAADSFHSPFTARPLRIRVVNYERQFMPPKHVATPDEAERLVVPHAHNMPEHQSRSFVSMQQNDEPIQSYSRNAFAGGSYLQEVRRRMRVGGGKIHTPATALNIPNVSSEAVEQNPRRLSPTNDAKRLFDNDIESSENRTRTVVTRRFIPQTTDLPTTTKNVAESSTRTEFQETSTVSTTEPSTTPVKVLPVFPGEDITSLDDKTDQRKNVSLQPLSELEIKSDFALQKTLQRTTVRTETYTERPVIRTRTFPTPLSTTASPAPVVFTLPTLFPALPEQNIGPLGIQNVPSHVNGTLGAGFPSPFVAAQLNLQPQQHQTAQQAPLERHPSRPNDPNTLEQLGCGFDLLTQSCKDVFAFGWCQQCTDLGNVFLHDCKCAAPTQLGRTASALFTNPPTTPVPGHTIPNGFLPTQSTANTWTRK